MKKRNYLHWLFSLALLTGLAVVVSLSSCKKDNDDPQDKDPVASFQYEISAGNWLEVTFTNYSTNATSYEWNFGNGETSTESDPTHVYAAAGTYDVVLVAKNDAGVSKSFTDSFELTDPNSALTLLAGTTSKTWKLYRVGTSMSLGPNAEDPYAWWAGLENDGARPCLYKQTFTFHVDGSYVFDDKGTFWGEYGVFNGQPNYEICFDATPENMINLDGINVSDWLSGTHAFTYDAATGTLTLNGNGAWIGIPKLGPSAETTVPIASTSCNISIAQEEGHDIMTLVFDWGEAGYWLFKYVNYSDTSLEPEIIEIQPPYGEDLPDLTPTEMWNTFETSTSFVVLDTAGVYPGDGPAANSMTFAMDVADPAGAGTNCGQYDRWGMWQELQFMMKNDIQFDNFTTVSLDVYVPSSNDYSGSLTKGIAIVIGEASQTEGWWNGHIQYDAEATVMDEWVTYTFDLDSPTSGPGGYTPFERTDLDFFAISLGGGGHEDAGVFYIRNFTFN